MSLSVCGRYARREKREIIVLPKTGALTSIRVLRQATQVLSTQQLATSPPYFLASFTMAPAGDSRS